MDPSWQFRTRPGEFRPPPVHFDRAGFVGDEAVRYPVDSFPPYIHHHSHPTFYSRPPIPDHYSSPLPPFRHSSPMSAIGSGPWSGNHVQEGDPYWGGEGFNKRMRVTEAEAAAGWPDQPGRLAEMRLNLIRDHGRQGAEAVVMGQRHMNERFMQEQDPRSHVGNFAREHFYHDRELNIPVTSTDSQLYSNEYRALDCGIREGYQELPLQHSDGFASHEKRKFLDREHGDGSWRRVSYDSSHTENRAGTPERSIGGGHNSIDGYGQTDKKRQILVSSLQNQIRGHDQGNQYLSTESSFGSGRPYSCTDSYQFQALPLRGDEIHDQRGYMTVHPLRHQETMTQMPIEHSPLPPQVMDRPIQPQSHFNIESRNSSISNGPRDPLHMPGGNNVSPLAPGQVIVPLSFPSLPHIVSPGLPPHPPPITSSPFFATPHSNGPAPVNSFHACASFATQATKRDLLYKDPPSDGAINLSTELSSFSNQGRPTQFLGEGNSIKSSLTEKPTIIDASHIFKKPYRATRPDHFVVILRGLPGSGKSYLAKVLRDLEVENGGTAPRIHAMDDYFMSEVEKVDDSDGSKTSSGKMKKQIVRKVMEYCFEPEMEEAYRTSMLKAFKKTVEEGIFTFVIVDDRNLRVADFAQFWAIGKRSGYEVYLLEATYKDPIGCAARNVHGFTSENIKKMAECWEEAPELYLQIDAQTLLRGNDLNEDDIEEVDMDTEDAFSDAQVPSLMQDNIEHKETEQSGYQTPERTLKGGRWVIEEETVRPKELGSSKWSRTFDEDNDDDENDTNGRSNSLSGLIQAYSKNEKSVRWGDQGEKRVFFIGATKDSTMSTLIIGPGCGYNLSSNPLTGEEANVNLRERGNASETKKRSEFLEHLRAERESFKAVFDRRRHRIGGLRDTDDD